MAGWTVKSSSGMASIYDSVSASSELVYKAFIHKNVQSGWSVCEEGSIPLAPVFPFASVSAAPEKAVGSTARAKASASQRGASLQLQRMADSPLGDSVVQCMNTTLGSVHLFVCGDFKKPRTLCGKDFGSRLTPAKNCEFASSSSKWTGDNCFFGFCERCYGDCYPKDRCVPTPKKGKKASQAQRTYLTDSDSGSSSSSSESDS